MKDSMDPPSFLVFLGINQNIVGYGLSPFCYGCVYREDNEATGGHSVVLKIVLTFRGTLQDLRPGRASTRHYE